MKAAVRILGALLVSALAISQALAADPAPNSQVQQAIERFKAADKNGDGKLTLEEAKAGMPRIAANFDKLDTEKKGYLTLDQVKAAAAR
ncbi:EF-hand domain-containing protein [Orrella sp. NBD-18]|uniref:EF-hand domain-containing protein n=1 Tax=Sheuella amnicola TaxID=2707330 RepID=A0A6B2QVH0_9BURK|nr:EF-hand domain-containing protein [Sheuella amnicola]NDY82072.1 EF-hand domain-containing protein [Sheuella amnicola]